MPRFTTLGDHHSDRQQKEPVALWNLTPALTMVSLSRTPSLSNVPPPALCGPGADRPRLQGQLWRHLTVRRKTSTPHTHTLHCPVIIVNTSIMASNIMSLKLCALLGAEEGLENVLDLQDFPQLKPSEGICTHICICRAATKSPVMSEIFWSLKPDLRRDQMSVFLLRSLESQ